VTNLVPSSELLDWRTSTKPITWDQATQCGLSDYVLVAQTELRRIRFERTVYLLYSSVTVEMFILEPTGVSVLLALLVSYRLVNVGHTIVALFRKLISYVKISVSRVVVS